ncbi:hypothetical protein GCM10027440_37530 [Nocardiopsis coralliicola]
MKRIIAVFALTAAAALAASSPATADTLQECALKGGISLPTGCYIPGGGPELTP